MDNNFQSNHDHVHQQQYLNYAYQILQKNCQYSNNNNINQQRNCTSYQTFNTTTTLPNNNVNVNINQTTQSLSHCNLQAQQHHCLDVYNNSSTNGSFKVNAAYQQQNFRQANFGDGVFMDNTQYWRSMPNQNQYLNTAIHHHHHQNIQQYQQKQQQQMQCMQNGLQQNQSILMSQYLAKVSQPLVAANMQMQKSNLATPYNNIYSFDAQNQDISQIHDYPNRMITNIKQFEQDFTNAMGLQNCMYLTLSFKII